MSLAAYWNGPDALVPSRASTPPAETLALTEKFTRIAEANDMLRCWSHFAVHSTPM